MAVTDSSSAGARLSQLFFGEGCSDAMSRLVRNSPPLSMLQLEDGWSFSG